MARETLKSWGGGALGIAALIGALERNTQAVMDLASQHRAEQIERSRDLEERRKALDEAREKELRALRSIAAKVGVE